MPVQNTVDKLSKIFIKLTFTEEWAFSKIQKFFVFIEFRTRAIIVHRDWVLSSKGHKSKRFLTFRRFYNDQGGQRSWCWGLFTFKVFETLPNFKKKQEWSLGQEKVNSICLSSSMTPKIRITHDRFRVDHIAYEDVIWHRCTVTNQVIKNLRS